MEEQKPLLPEVILQNCIKPNMEPMEVGLEAMKQYAQQEIDIHTKQYADIIEQLKGEIKSECFAFLDFYISNIYDNKVVGQTDDDIYTVYLQHKQQSNVT